MLLNPKLEIVKSDAIWTIKTMIELLWPSNKIKNLKELVIEETLKKENLCRK